MTPADPRLAMLADMGACAYRLGMAFGTEAERARTAADRLQYFQLFDRCFFAVRVGVALELRLKREAGRGAAGVDREHLADRAERDPPEDERAEPLERERPETLEYAERLEYTERDREREAEGASLPLLLRTLEGVAADAAALPGPPPAALPTLQDLLARFSSDAVAPPGPVSGSVLGSGGGHALRARLTGSAAALAASPAAGQTLTLSPPAPPPAPPNVRDATGPPRS
jgi:hypothetical protein